MKETFYAFAAMALLMCSGARAEPGSDDRWAAGVVINPVLQRSAAPPGVPIQVQYAPQSDEDFARSLLNRFDAQTIGRYLLPLRKLIQKDFYLDVDDSVLLQGALRGDPAGRETNLAYSAMKGMVAALNDHYSSVLNPQEFAAFEKQMEGTRLSFGFVYGPDRTTGRMKVLGTYRGGPADRAGVSAGDGIVSAQADGDVLVMQLERPRTGARYNVRLTREEISLPDVASHLFAEKGVGYVYVQHFTREIPNSPGTADNFSFQLATLRARSLRGLIVDMRDNPGGDLKTCMQMASMFLPGNATILLRKLKGKPPMRWGDTSGNAGPYAAGPPMVVLVNHDSASCSEIFAAAMQDNRRAAIIGSSNCTFGKGVVQTLYTPKEGELIRLTTEQWFRPNGATIQGVGVCPDSGRAVDIPAEQKDAVTSRVEAQVYGESGYLYNDPMVAKALDFFGAR